MDFPSVSKFRVEEIWVVAESPAFNAQQHTKTGRFQPEFLLGHFHSLNLKRMKELGAAASWG